MALVADEHDVAPGFDLALGLAVNLGNQRAGRIEPVEPAAGRGFGHRFGHAVGAEHHRHAIGHFVQFLDEHRPLGLQAIDHEAIVDDLVADIDRRAIALQRQLDDLDRAVHAGAEPARRGQQQAQGSSFGGRQWGVHDAASSALPRAPLGQANRDSKDAQMTARFRLISALAVAAVLAGCKTTGDIVVDEGVGIQAVRTACPAVGIPDYTGDITLFRVPGDTSAANIDVVATMTNLRSQCNDSGEKVFTNVTFEVQARRTDTRGARQVTIPYFVTVLRGGKAVVTKRVGQVTLNFADGQERAQASGQGSAYVDKAEASLPPEIRERITRRRRAGEEEAAVDPLSQPEVKAAIARATFEVLVGFQLSQDQLTFNATR